MPTKFVAFGVEALTSAGVDGFILKSGSDTAAAEGGMNQGCFGEG